MWKLVILSLPVLLVRARRAEDVKFRRLQSQPQGSPAPLAGQSHVRSLVECAKVCTSHFRCSCRGYQFHKAARTCQVFPSTLTAGAGNSDESVYYTTDFALGGIGSSCKANEDCDCVPGSVCSSTVCQCPPGQVFNETSSLCQCPPDQMYNATSSLCQCPPGQVYNPTYSLCQCPAGQVYNATSSLCQCPPGQMYNATFRLCQCSPGQVYNATSSLCQCPSGQMYNATLSLCQCPTGQVYNATSSLCQCTSGQVYNTTSSLCQCPAGHVYNTTASLCQCPAGQVYNATSSLCQCPAGQVYSTTASLCQCPTGQVYNATSSLCQCPVGQVYSTTSSLCQCPTGQVYNTTSSLCQCPAGQVYSATSSLCQQEKILKQECSTNPLLQSLPETYCLNGTCCKMGYHFDLRSKSCHAACPGSYGDTYYMVRSLQCIDGNNNVTNTTGMTFEQCWQFCKADPKCRSFEYAATRCYLSYVTVLEVPCAWKSCPDMTYYQRNCA